MCWCAPDRQSFLNTARWIDEVRTERGSDVIIVLVGAPHILCSAEFLICYGILTQYIADQDLCGAPHGHFLRRYRCLINIEIQQLTLVCGLVSGNKTDLVDKRCAEQMCPVSFLLALSIKARGAF